MLALYPVNVEKEVAYARRWAYARNPAFHDFDPLGGDCTNFISQRLFAGGAVMNPARDVGWYFHSLNDRAAAWTGVEFFYRFITTNGGVGPFGTEVPLHDAQVGDVIQLGSDAGFHHSLLTVDVVDGEPYVAAHTSDCFDRPLSTYAFRFARALRVVSYRKYTAVLPAG